MKSIFCLLLLGWVGSASAQTLSRQLISPLSSSSHPQLSYSLGEVATQTGQSGTLVLTQGFQQPNQDLISQVAPAVELTYQLYPNPARDQLHLELNLEKALPLALEILDLRGRAVLPTKQLMASTAHRLTLDVSPLAEGCYFLRLRGPGQSTSATIRFARMH